MSETKLTPDEIYDGIGPQSLVVPVDWLPVTAGGTNDTPPQGFYRALRATGAGTITVTTPGGSGRVLNFADGETRYGVFLSVDAASGPTAIEGGV